MSVPVPRTRQGALGSLLFLTLLADARPSRGHPVRPDVQADAAQEACHLPVVFTEHEQYQEQRGTEKRDGKGLHADLVG